MLMHPGARLTHAQVALPETRLTYRSAYQIANGFNVTSQGVPELSAAGQHVLGVWVDDGIADGINLGVAHVDPSTKMWVNNLPLMLSPPYTRLFGPHAAFVERTGRAGIMTSQRIQTYHSTPNLAAFEFGPMVLAAAETPEYLREDLKSLAGDPATGHVYGTHTSSRGDYPFISQVIDFLRSADGGQTWAPPATLSSQDASASTVVVGPDGELVVAWMDYQQGRLVGRRSTDHGLSFSPEFTIGSPAENFGASPKGWVVPVHSSTRYNPFHTLGSSFYAPSYPRLAVDRGTGPSRGRLHAVWAERATGTLAPLEHNLGEIEDNNSLPTAQVIAMNTELYGSLPGYEDTGENDFDIFTFDGQAGQLVYVHGDILGDGYISPISPTFVWVLYGTRANGAVEGIYRGPMVRFTAGGAQPSYITLPRTGRYYIAIDQGSRSFDYFLRLRSFQPTASSAALDMRDIVITSSSDGGQTWSAPRRVNHGPGDSDQHMPNVAVDERGRVYVAWYDRRGFELSDSVHAYAAVSADGGLTFGADMKLSGVPSFWGGSPNVGGRGESIGDRIAVAAGADFGVVAWADFRDTFNGAIDPNVYSARIVDTPVAVLDISDFSAAPVAEGVRLRWIVHDVRSISGLRVLRTQDGGEEIALGAEDLLVRATGAGEFLDRTAEPGTSYRYRLRVARGAGADWLGPVEVTLPTLIASLSWRGAQPNPFAAGTSLRLAVPVAAAGAVRVYDLQGKEVRTLKEGLFEVGEASLAWDGRDARGEAVAPGVYFLDAHVGGASVQMKLARVR